MEQRAQEVTSHERARDANYNIGDQALPIIGLHDDTGYPADQSPYDDPYNEVDQFLLLLNDKIGEAAIYEWFMNSSYNEHSPVTSIDRGVFISATWGSPQMWMLRA